MNISTREFDDEKGRIWSVTKIGFGSFEIEPKSSEKLCDIARSCVRKIGLKATADGTPVEFVNEHSRVWNAIWKDGRETRSIQLRG